MIQFAWPWLILLLPVPAVIYWLVPKAQRQQTALRAPFLMPKQGEQSEIKSQNAHWLILVILSTIWICTVIAATRPQWIGESISLPAQGRDLMLAVDISDSMKIEDMTLQGSAVHRLAAVKEIVGDFIKERQGDRLGLILFGTRAYLQAPLTFDLETINTLLQETQFGFAGKQTAIGDAIGLSIKRLQQRPSDSRVVILLTDGANTAGEVEPLQAAKLAAQENVKIYTIGIGANEMVVPGLFGSRFGQRRVNPSQDLDEETLRSIAEQTQGRYFRARNTDELREIYTLIEQLEPVEQEQESIRPTKALYYWPLALAAILSLLLTSGQLIAQYWSLQWKR